MLKYLFVFLFGVSILKAQNLEKARSIIDTLCSQEMFGRGYTKDGHQKAANYISNECKSRGLKAFNKSYLQSFPILVNTFPEEPILIMGKEKMVLGKDYIVKASSKSCKGKFTRLKVTNQDLSSAEDFGALIGGKKKNKSALIIDKRELDSDKKEAINQLINYYTGYPLVVVIDTNKLTASMSQVMGKMTIVHLKVDSDYSVPKTIGISVSSKLVETRSNNVVAYFEGIQHPDSFVVFSAHYDHLGGYGDSIYFPGANDNASGIAMLLELADEFQKMDSLKYSVVFIAFGGEEVGLIGSKYFTENPLFPLESIKVLINTDILGTGVDGIKMVNATANRHVYDTFINLNEKLNLLKYIGKRGPAANSDHYFFSLKEVPAVFIYTLGGISAYHDIFDIPSTLPLTKFLSIKKLLLSYFLTL